MYYNESYIAILPTRELFRVLEYLEPEKMVLSAWFQKYIHFIIKHHSENGENIIVEYVLTTDIEALQKINIANYFMLNCIEFNVSKLFKQYFNYIVDEISYPFMWDKVIIEEALKFNAWWAIIIIWDRQDKTDWHPLDRRSIILEAITNSDKNAKQFIVKCKRTKSIQKVALEEYLTNEMWVAFIDDEVKSVFIF